MSRSRRSDDSSRRFGEERRRAQEAERRWREVYGPEVAESLRWDARYWIVRVGEAEFAFSDYDGYVTALEEAWATGLVPDYGPSSVRGIDLPEAAPDLRAVDADIRSHVSSGTEPES